MDDPTRWCENDASIETRLPGLPVPSGSPSFFLPTNLLPPQTTLLTRIRLLIDPKVLLEFTAD